MPLDRNQETFETFMHRRIWGLYMGTLSIEKAMPYAGDEYVKSCGDLCEFYRAIYEDMYSHIDYYGFYPGDIPEISREATLLKKKPEQIFWYFAKFIGDSDIDKNGNLVVATAVYRKKVTNNKHIKANAFIFGLMEKHGLVISDFGESTVISNTKYPGMFRIMVYSHRNKLYNWGDFRKKTDGYDLMTEVLGDKQKRIANEIDGWLRSNGAKREKKLSIGRIIYRNVKQIIAYMYHEDCRLIFAIMLDYQNVPFEAIVDKLTGNKGDGALTQFIFDHQKQCTFCNDYGCNFFTSYKDKTLRVCRQRGGVYFQKFDETEMGYIKRLIDNIFQEAL